MSYDASVNNPTPNVFEVEVIANNDLVTAVEEARQYAEDAENSADSASASASSASASASNANNFANSASNSASSASSSASTATTQAGIATTQAGIATTQAGIATTKANEASQSAFNALASEQASAQSEANALASEQASAQSEANALSSEQSAIASASTATTQAGIATTQAGIATTQAGIATTQASNALNSANAAAASAASAAAVGTSTVLTGFSVGANTAIAGTDTILQAFNKTQGQVNARVSGTGVAGQVSFWTATGTQSGDSAFLWDNVNKRLRINQSTDAGFRLDVNGTVRIQGALTTNLTAGRVPFIGTNGVLSDDSRLLYSSTDNTFEIQGLVGALPRLRFNSLSAGDTAYMFIDFVGIRSTTGVAVRIRANRRGTLDFMTQDLPGSVDPVLRWSINNTGIFQADGAQTIQTSTGNLTLATAGGNGNIVLTPNGTGNVSITDAKDIALGTTTGTKIGTSASQKLSLWNATPITQPTTSVSGATRVGGGGTNITDTDTFDGYTLAQIVKGLRNMGAFA